MSSNVTDINPIVHVTDTSGNTPALPPIRVEFHDNGFTVYAEGSGGDARLFVYTQAGGHYELQLLRSFPDGHGQTLDNDGYIAPTRT